jgi:hypothetical protein
VNSLKAEDDSLISRNKILMRDNESLNYELENFKLDFTRKNKMVKLRIMFYLIFG